MWPQVLGRGAEHAIEQRLGETLERAEVALGRRLEARALRDGGCKLYNDSQRLLRGSTITMRWHEHEAPGTIQGVTWERGYIYELETELDTGHTVASEEQAAEFIAKHMSHHKYAKLLLQDPDDDLEAFISPALRGRRRVRIRHVVVATDVNTQELQVDGSNCCV